MSPFGFRLLNSRSRFAADQTLVCSPHLLTRVQTQLRNHRNEVGNPHLSFHSEASEETLYRRSIHAVCSRLDAPNGAYQISLMPIVKPMSISISVPTNENAPLLAHATSVGGSSSPRSGTSSHEGAGPLHGARGGGGTGGNGGGGTPSGPFGANLSSAVASEIMYCAVSAGIHRGSGRGRGRGRASRKGCIPVLVNPCNLSHMLLPC